MVPEVGRNSTRVGWMVDCCVMMVSVVFRSEGLVVGGALVEVVIAISSLVWLIALGSTSDEEEETCSSEFRGRELDRDSLSSLTGVATLLVDVVIVVVSWGVVSSTNLTALVVVGSGVVVRGRGLRVVRIDSNVVGRIASVVISTFFDIGEAGE